MKKNILILMLLLGTITLVQAQKNDNKKSKDIDELFENFDNELLGKNMSSMLQQIQESQNNVKYDKSYTFNLHSKVKSDITSNGKTESNIIGFYSSEQASMMKPESSNTKHSEDISIIFDNKNKTIITIDEQEKSGMAMSLDGIGNIMKQFGSMYQKEDAEQEKPNYSITKTGKTKTILGYSCSEYLIISNDKDENTESSVWVSKDTKIIHYNIMNALGKDMIEKSNTYKNQLNGAVLEMHSKNLKTGNTYDMTVIELNQKSISKDLSNYKITSGFDFNAED